MLAIEVEFLHGTFRAASREDAALTGRAEHGEWPPSPARLFASLVSAGGTSEFRGAASDGGELHCLEGPPVVEADDVGDVVTTVLNERFVVIDKSEGAVVQNYPGRKAQVVRPGVRLAPRDVKVRYRWEGVDPTAAALEAIRRRAAGIGYLGCSDSPVRVRVLTDVPDVSGSANRSCWVPDPGGDVQLSVPYPGLVADLDDLYRDFVAGRPQRRAWLPPHLVRYRSPSFEPDPGGRAHTVWLRFDSAINGRRILAVAETLRSAVLERFDEQVGGRAAVPALVHGHHEVGATGYEHIRFLPLPHAGFAHADGRLRGACIWLPPEAEQSTIEGVRDAVSHITHLSCPGVFSVGVSVFDNLREPWASNPGRWAGPARRWVSVAPVIYERFTKGKLASAEVGRWCSHAGLPAPLRFRTAEVPLVPGAIQLSSREVFRSGEPRRPFAHFELEFAESIEGPIAIGRGRHFGLGLMAPVRSGSAR